MKMQQRTLDWIFSGLIILAAVAVIVAGGTRVSAASETTPQIFAQATQLKQSSPTVKPGGARPGSLKQKTTEVKVICGGKTKAECCEGISYCACFASLGDDDKPLFCDSSPPPSKD
jgi:hypothetical protein